jgi:beta-N-acetylglucosaminidase
MLASLFTILVFFSSGKVLASEPLSPKGYIDTPVNGAPINGSSVVKGWFLDGSGVSKIEILVDGQIMGTAEYGSGRSDVLKVFPEYQNANSGFQFTLDTKYITNGQHTLTVKETGENGNTTVLTNIVNVQNFTAKGYIDTPPDGATINGSTIVQGWFLDGSGVSKIEILIDGQSMGVAQYGGVRTDVLKAFPEYQNANSGYQFTLDTKNITSGQHLLTIRETGNNGNTTVLSSQKVNIQSLSPKGYIDSPTDGATIRGSSVVQGWFLDGSGVAKIEILVDGQSKGIAQYGSVRPDIVNAFPGYQNANSGYQFTLDTKNISNGQHSLTVRETGNNGNTTVLTSQTINVQNLTAKGYLDSPSVGATINGLSVVQGWFLDGSGVSKIEVLVDGQSMGMAQYGSVRPDIVKAFPEYQNANSGYQYTLDTRNITNGEHSLTVRETSNNGNSTVLVNQKIFVQNLIAKGIIDTPLPGVTITGSSVVRGWFLDGSGVSKIEVLVDGQSMGMAQYGIVRPDVMNVFPEYQNANSGYQYTLDTSKLSDGQHTLAVKETALNGSMTTLTTKVTVSNGNPYLLVNLKKPSNITANDIINFFNQKSPNSPLKDYAQSFIDAQTKYGVNAQYLVAHAIWETGWGGSALRTYKHNLFGYGAFNVCPFTCGYYFPTGPDSIYKVAYQVRHDYLDASGAYYFSNYGPTLTGMNVKYATDQNWKNGIASLMASMKPFDYTYYASTNELNTSASSPPYYGIDIPDGQAFPSDTIISFPTGVTAKINLSMYFRTLPYVSSSTIISTLPQNAVVTVLGYNTDVSYDPKSTGNYAYKWYRVNVNGKNGWLYGQYLDIQNLFVVNISSSTLRIRSSTSTNSDSNILTTVNNGSYLKPVMNNGNLVTADGWYQVYLPNSTTTGWVAGDCVAQIMH